MPDRFALHRLSRAWDLLRRWAEEGGVPAVGAVVGSADEVLPARLFGRQAPAADAPPVRDDAIFLIASPTKPIVGLAVLRLVEQGQVKLTDPVARYVPEFAAEGKRSITLAHCLTHTSGLPDMLPDNAELRARQAPLGEFLSRACGLKPDFAPGRGVQYQSLGFLMLGEVAHQVSGRQVGELLREEVFEPLGMTDTALGMPPSWEQLDSGAPRVERIAEVRLPGDAHSSVWNTAYWRKLGAPWGGLLSTPADLGRLCQHLLKIQRGEAGILRPVTLAAMTANQLERMPHVPEAARRCQPWGLGWRLNWPHDPQTFGDLLSPAAYGHWGATGTMVWIDPARDAFAVVLSTEPLDFERGRFAEFSNAVCAALA
jgi:CubicO group peptidase (beta-lactamase class C family)